MIFDNKSEERVLTFKYKAAETTGTSHSAVSRVLHSLLAQLSSSFPDERARG